MKINYFSQIGKRENNEDFIGYTDYVFIVCDGVGGHTSGEFASRFVVEKIITSTEKSEPEFSKINIQQLLLTTQEELNCILKEKPELEKMGTTFTGIFKTNDAWFAAHIGDSRIYFVRPVEQIVWHTWDHSFVGELMRKQMITREAGRFHPMSNSISKAILANNENNTARADIIKIDNILKGDIFMLCTDGINEAWSDYELIKLLCNTKLSPDEKCITIKEKCQKLSKDNNSAIIICFDKNDEISQGDNEELAWISLNELKEDFHKFLSENTDNILHNESKNKIDYESGKTLIKKIKSRKKWLWVFYFVLLLVFSWAIYKGFIIKSKPDPISNKEVLVKPNNNSEKDKSINSHLNADRNDNNTQENSTTDEVPDEAPLESEEE